MLFIIIIIIINSYVSYREFPQQNIVEWDSENRDGK
jgi:hypothetical protein